MKTLIRNRLIAMFMLLAVVWLNGFHILALQAVAWTQMFQEYNQLMSSSDALEFTVSGKELCGVCIIADEIQSEMEEELDEFFEIALGASFVLPPEERIELSDVPTLYFSESFEDRMLKEFDVAVDSPPPRGLFA